MRKYYQAILLIVAVISLISLLFYQHEYNKLRNVFNYFGKVEHKDIVDNCTKIDIKQEKLNLEFDEPFSSWQRLNDDLFVYSSYTKNNREIITIAFGKLRSNFDFHCNINIESEILSGKFSYSILKNTTDILDNEEFCGYLLKCELEEENNPIGVTYFETTTNNDNIILPIKQLSKFLDGSEYAFCISPIDNKIPSLLDVTNFLNTHKLLGVEDFIIYDYNMPIIMDKILKNQMKTSCTKISWNFPFFNIRKRIIMSLMELDCLYRTYNRATYSALLTWDENIVLNYHSSLHNLMIDFKKNKMFGDRFMLNSSIFCKQNNKTRASAVGIKNQKSNLNNRSLYIFKPIDILDNENIKTMEVLSDLVEVKRYQLCINNEQKGKQKIVNFRKSFRFAADI
ncbi:uncharacterized protein LOC127279973 [Leptopilina boulardi]|uniref:uncharacterized protein LOC127279973 n=1 Tax=Leptopilina boulardi TaxID=63433 RepID=UPI0021F63294|nr:uncharacterized protein LOC127279973 [Leptopilina boulardi]